MKLIIDIGNTFTKLALFDSNKLIKEIKKDMITIQKIQSFIGSNEIKSSILSTVVINDISLIKFLKEKFQCLMLTENTPIPIKSLYSNIETLGKDRIAAMVGARIQFPEDDLLVFDAGTCLTVDYLDVQNIHHGGRIMPGIQMRYDSLNHFTSKLPQLYLESEQQELIGTDTESAIHSGVQQGVIAEISSIIQNYKKENPDIIVILTGEDCFFLEEALKNTIFVDSFLVLKGLNTILEYNEKI